MENKKVSLKNVLFWGVPSLLLLVLLILSLAAYLDYNEFDRYQKEIRDNKFDVRDLNLLKKKVSLKRLRLDELTRKIRLDFRPSELKADIEKVAVKSGIPVNKLAIIKFKTKNMGKGRDQFLLQLSIEARFKNVGAFIARLERFGISGNGNFNYLVNIKKLDFAVIKLNRAELRSRLELSVMRRRF